MCMKTSISNEYKHTISCMKISIMLPKPLHTLARTHNTRLVRHECIQNQDQPHWEKNIHKPQDFSPLKSIETKAQRNQSQEAIYLPSQCIRT